MRATLATLATAGLLATVVSLPMAAAADPTHNPWRHLPPA
jgi:hypothetical protein